MSGRRGPKRLIGSLTTSDRFSLDVRRLQRQGVLVAGTSFRSTWGQWDDIALLVHGTTHDDHLTLVHAAPQQPTRPSQTSYRVPLTWTSCHMGGERVWFRCPHLTCRRRVAKLYFAGVFSCRHCQGLAYQSQRERGPDRAARKADRIREKLGWYGGVLEGHGPKPVGMHWATFERLVARHDRFAREALGSMPIYIEELGY